MADLILITRNLLDGGSVTVPGENIDYPRGRLSDRDKNEICKFATYDLMDGDILNEDCSALPGTDPAWTDNDGGDGDSTAAEGKFNLHGGSAGAANFAQLDAALGAVIRTAATRTTIEISLNHTTLGTLANGDYFELLVELSANLAFRARFCTDGLFIRGASADLEVGVNIVATGADITFRFAIDHGIEQLAKVNVYKDGTLVAWGFDCAYYSAGGFIEGDVRLLQKGDTTANTETDVDYLYIDADLYPGLIRVDVDQSSDPRDVDIAIIEGHNWDGQPVALRYFKDLTGGILNESFANLDNWTDQDNNGESTAVTFDDQTCARFYVPTAGAGNIARRARFLGSVMGTQTTVEIKLYPALIGTLAAVDSFTVIIGLAASLRLMVAFASNGLWVYDGAAWNEVGTDVVDQDTWQTWRFVIDHRVGANTTCNIYKKTDGGSFELVAKNFNCSDTTAWSEGQIQIEQTAWTVNNALTYVDYLKIDGDLLEWTDAVTPWVQSGNDRIVKTWADVTAPLWRLLAGELPGLLCNEKCVSFTDPYTWTDQGGGDGASTEVIGSPGTYDRVFSFDAGTAGAANYARRSVSLGSVFGTKTTIEIELYHSVLGIAGQDSFDIIFNLSSSLQVTSVWGSDGLIFYDGVGWHEVGTDLVRYGADAVLQKWRFVINHEIEHEATVDVYLDDVLQAVGLDCSNIAAGAEGDCRITQMGNTLANALTYINYIKIDDGLIPPWQTLSAPQAAEITLGLLALNKPCAWPGPRGFGNEPNTFEHFSKTGHRWPAKRGEPRWVGEYEIRGLASSERAELAACLGEIGYYKSFYLYDHEGILRHVHLREPAVFSTLTNNKWKVGLKLMEAL